MKGKVLNYDAGSKSGVVSGDDGMRYSFQSLDWKQQSEPRSGAKVDFVGSNGSAAEIYTDSAMAGGTSKKIAASLLALFLGVFGAHKFYLGYQKQGIIMLLVFIFGFILLGIPSMVVGVIAFIEFIMYITKSDDDFERIYVIEKKKWF